MELKEMGRGGLVGVRRNGGGCGVWWRGGEGGLMVEGNKECRRERGD